jgi:hypothetical protein
VPVQCNIWSPDNSRIQAFQLLTTSLLAPGQPEKYCEESTHITAELIDNGGTVCWLNDFYIYQDLTCYPPWTPFQLACVENYSATFYLNEYGQGIVDYAYPGFSQTFPNTAQCGGDHGTFWWVTYEDGIYNNGDWPC